MLGLQKRKITARARTCRPMPVPGPLVPFSTRWRERDRWHRWGIGGEYLKSPAQISGEWVDEASAPSLVTPRGRHLNRAAIQRNQMLLLTVTAAVQLSRRTIKGEPALLRQDPQSETATAACQSTDQIQQQPRTTRTLESDNDPTTQRLNQSSTCHSTRSHQTSRLSCRSSQKSSKNTLPVKHCVLEALRT